MNGRRCGMWMISLAVALAGRSIASEPAQTDVPRFTNVIASSGIDYKQARGPYELYSMPATLVGGVALLDYDGDGLLDIYLLQGNDLTPGKSDPALGNRLYRNLGNWRFRDVTAEAGVGDSGYALSAAAADIDNDGDVDLYVCNHGPNVLYVNNGDRTFRRVDDAALAGNESSSACAFADFDGDGLVDLYVVNYVDWVYGEAPRCDEKGKRVHCGPARFTATPDRLYRNKGSGVFEEVTAGSGIELEKGTGLGIVVADFNNDGRPDIFVANDVNPNFLFVNDGKMKFREEGLLAWVAVNGEGNVESNMGIACGDYDNNGFLDLFVTHFTHETNTLFANVGDLIFEDRTNATDLGKPSRGRMAWGTSFLDYDRDGWLDLVVANGHIESDPQDSAPHRQKPQLFHNARQRFVDVSDQAGDYFREGWVGRGLAVGDLDNDGDTDLVIGHQDGAPALLRNDTKASGHWIRLELVGGPSNRSAINAQVTLTLGDEKRTHEVIGGGSFAASSDPRPLLGMGDRASVDRLQVRWPSGKVQTWTGLAADAGYRLTEGRDQAEPAKR